MALVEGQKAIAVSTLMHGFVDGQEITFVHLSNHKDEHGKPYYVFKGVISGEEFRQELVETEFKLIEEGENLK